MSGYEHRWALRASPPTRLGAPPPRRRLSWDGAAWTLGRPLRYDSKADADDALAVARLVAPHGWMAAVEREVYLPSADHGRQAALPGLRAFRVLAGGAAATVAPDRGPMPRGPFAK